MRLKKYILENDRTSGNVASRVKPHWVQVSGLKEAFVSVTSITIYIIINWSVQN